MTLIPSTTLPLYIAIILAAIALVIVLLAVVGRKYSKIAVGLSIAGFSVAILLLLLDGTGTISTPTSPSSGTVIASDWVSIFFGVSILAVSLLVGIAAMDYMKDSPNFTSFYALLVFTTIGALMLAFSTDLLMIFVAWELMSIPSYVLVGFRKKSPESNEAAVKYFLISAFASGVLLYGISLVYLLTGTTNIYTVLESAPGFGPIAVLALTFVLAGFGIKLAAVPFHMWIPDSYQGAPTVVSALLSAGTKGAAFAPAARIFFIIFGTSAYHNDWSLVFAVLAILSMTLGNFAALTQKSVTRILAYSSIGQAGYILIGFASGGTVGLTGSFFHILNYAVMQSGAFLAAALIIRQVGSDDLKAFDGVGRRLKISPIALTVSLLALGGIPPLSGFWSKFVLFYSAIHANLGWLAAIAIINSFVSIAFYFRIIKHMYIDERSFANRLVESNGFKVTLILATAIIIIGGIYPGPFIQFASITANSFLNP